MNEVSERPKFVERALLVGAHTAANSPEETDGLLDELDDLVGTLGITVVGRERVRVGEWHARFLIGTGKVTEIIALAKDLQADVIVFDNELSPAQQRNWEEEAKLTVVDRQEIILDIFARRARTKEAQLQVKLARMEYTLPRLKRAWAHLGRQGGGGGAGGAAVRGEGEQQIELDRRMVRQKIDQLKSELALVRKNRATQRKNRQRIPIPQAALVGYTNAGKSSMLRALTGSDVLVADQLFSTLDTTTRRIDLPSGQPLLLTDTVGFVRKLPHRLVESFKATLEEAVVSDFLIHVVDAGHPLAEVFLRTTMDVLAELGADEKKIITVFNKIDTFDMAEPHVSELRWLHPDAIWASATTGQGLPALCERMANVLASHMTQLHLRIPHACGHLFAELHAHGRVLEEVFEPEYVDIVALIPVRRAHHFSNYLRSESITAMDE